MAHLPQLIDVESYVPCDWDLKLDAAGREYWVAHFVRHLELLLRLIEEQYPDAPAKQVAAFRADYLTTMRSVAENPGQHERIDVLLLDELRHDLLVRHRFDDPFQGIKRRENAAALAQLPRLLAELDGLSTEQRPEALAVGLLAGNVFDLGSEATVAQFEAGELDFARSRRQQPRRPWLVDDLGAWRQYWLSGRGYHHVFWFVDNAGCDICLGCLPMVRWMLGAGSRVTLAANSRPALNDVTAPELEGLLREVSKLDATLSGAVMDGTLCAVWSGGRTPLLDVRRVSDACAAAAVDADLIVLQGMGRAIESNYHARFACDVVRAAVLKDKAVAGRLGGGLFDCVFGLDRAGRSPAVR